MKINKVFVVLLLSLFLLASCRGYADRTTFSENYFVGTEGIELEFIGDSPPRETLENTEFPLALQVYNKGAFSLEEDYHATITYTYDSFYLQPIAGINPQEVDIQLKGKSYAYPIGDFDTVILPSFVVKPVIGQRENPHTDLFVNVCYPYNTILTEEVCIDTSTITNDQREKACDAQTTTYSGQGAPVAVSRVTPEIQSRGLNLRPVFLIEVRDVGGGSVMAPVESSNIANACEYQKTPEAKDDWNKVDITARLFGEELVCQPEQVQLDEGRGLTRCYLDGGGFVSSSSYVANLIVELDYVYSSSLSKRISIVRSEIPDLAPLNDGCPYWATRVQGQCIPNCEVCADNPNHPLCQATNFDETWSCSCSQTECVDAFDEEGNPNEVAVRSSSCIHGPGFCDPNSPAQSFCCSK